MIKVYVYRTNSNNEIISCKNSRCFKDLESAMKYFNRMKCADLIDYDNEREYTKR